MRKLLLLFINSPGSAIPIASTAEDMVLAVNIPPAKRQTPKDFIAVYQLIQKYDASHHMSLTQVVNTSQWWTVPQCQSVQLQMNQ